MTININKLIVEWEFYRMIKDVPGSIVECGVFRGASLLCLALCRKVVDNYRSLIGFDTFTEFPEATYEADKEPRERFLDLNGDKNFTVEETKKLLSDNGGGWTYLIKGDVCETVPAYTKYNSDLRIALLNLDIDLYEPSKVVLEHFAPLMSPGGIIICDDYNVFPGETKAVDEYMEEHNLEIKRLDLFPAYYIKV